MKIAFLAYSVYGLIPYWQELAIKYDCWWVTTQPNTYKELKNLGYSRKTIYVEDIQEYMPDYEGNKFRSTNPGKAEIELDQILSPDAWITDQTNRLTHIKKRVPWIQVFHSLCYKKHTFHPLTMKYDLLLVPGNYHQKRFESKFPSEIKNRRLEMVGWPRHDYYKNNTYSDAQKKLQNLQLDYNLKNILYAPTWGGFDTNRRTWGTKLFARWFDTELDVLEMLCKFCADKRLNLIIKLHSLSICNENMKMRQIASKYGAKWITDNYSNLMENPFPYLQISDVLISDLSGVIMDYLPLDRPILFIDPEKSLNAWEDYSISPNLRPGLIVKNVDELLSGIQNSLTNSSQYSKMRKKVMSEIFAFDDGLCSQRSAKSIINFLNKTNPKHIK